MYPFPRKLAGQTIPNKLLKISDHNDFACETAKGVCKNVYQPVGPVIVE